MKQLNLKYILGTAIIVAFLAAIALPLAGLEWSAQADDYINAGERERLDNNNIASQRTTGCSITFFLKSDGSMELWWSDNEDRGVLLDSWANPPRNGTTVYQNPPPSPGVEVQWTRQPDDADGNDIWQVNIRCQNRTEGAAFEVKENTDGGRSLQNVGG